MMLGISVLPPPDPQWTLFNEKMHDLVNNAMLAASVVVPLVGELGAVAEFAAAEGVEGGIKGINVSLMDLGLALADAYKKEAFGPGGTATYEQLDDDLKIRFVTDGEAVRIAASDRPDEFVVERTAFSRAVVGFLCGFTSACAREVNGIMVWESMALLRDFAAKFCGN